MDSSQKPSEPVGKLYPTHTIRDQSRYKLSKTTQCGSLEIDVGANASPTYLPLHWSAHLQPEGKQYFYHDGELATVTESWMYTPNIATEVGKWIDHLTTKIKEKGIDLATSELYLHIDEDLDCLYYGVDKRNQTLFWVESHTTDELDLPQVASPSHLRTLLESHYWTHVERFPAHFGGLPEEKLSKLLDILTHCRMDQLTSTGYTFAYSPIETTALVKVLKDCRGRTREPEVVTTIARIWHLVQHNRFWNHYGEQNPRLDSSMSILAGDDRDGGPFHNRILSLLSFGKSEKFRTKLNSLFVDRLFICHRIEAFVNGLVKEWKDQYLPSFFMLLLHISFFHLIASQIVATASAACFSASLLTAFALVQQHDGLIEKQTPVAMDWLTDRASKLYKFQRLAFAFTLPTTFFNWGLVIFFGHWLFIGLSRLNTNVAATFIGLIALAIFAFIAVTSPDTIPTISLPRCFRTQDNSGCESIV